MHLVLFEPRIPPNTGNIARLCAATETPLHLIEPLGFSLEDRHLKRAGLDYWPYVDVRVWPDWTAFASEIGSGRRVVLTSARAHSSLYDFRFRDLDMLVLGPETEGLPDWLLNSYPDCLRVPIWGRVRSLNQANAAAICLFEAYRQAGRFRSP